MKKIVKLNENTIRKMVAEALKKALNEESYLYNTTMGGGKLGNSDNYRGCKSIKIRWHGENADPELMFNGYLINYYTIDDSMYEEAKSTGIDIDNDDEFDSFCQEHEKEIQDAIIEYGEKEENPFDENTLS